MACSRSVSGQRPCSACLPPALPAWVASCVRLQARSGGEAISVCFVFFFLFWRGGGGSTIHCHHSDPEVSRTYDDTRISTSRMLREYFAYDTPWCTHNRTYFDKHSNLLIRGGKGVTPWLAMLRGHLPTTTDAYQLTRLRTAGRPTGPIFTNDRCSLLYMNGCELSTFECRIHHAFGEESMAAPSTYRTVQGL